MREMKSFKLTWDSEIIYITERKERMGERRELDGDSERRPVRAAGSLSFFTSLFI